METKFFSPKSDELRDISFIASQLQQKKVNKSAVKLNLSRTSRANWWTRFKTIHGTPRTPYFHISTRKSFVFDALFQSRQYFIDVNKVSFDKFDFRETGVRPTKQPISKLSKEF